LLPYFSTALLSSAIGNLKSFSLKTADPATIIFAPAEAAFSIVEGPIPPST
jgi:hypothetical protein